MAVVPSTPVRRGLLALTASAMAVAGAVLPAATGVEGPTHSTKPAAATKVKPVTKGSIYLALGDSVAFGYREPTNKPTPDYAKPKSFVGYPEDVAANLGLKLSNASCPGETSGSLDNVAKASNGCLNHYDAEQKKQVPGGYRTSHPLHVRYTSNGQSQLAYAVAFLKKHPTTRLVTLTVGANDLFLCQATSPDGCQSLDELTATVNKVQANVAKLLKAIRTTAKYTGQIVVLDYYSPDYNNALYSGAIKDLNSHLELAANGYSVAIADGYKAFEGAAKQDGGDTCQARLITVVDTTTTPATCGVHPSVQGAALLAQTVERKIKK